MINKVHETYETIGLSVENRQNLHGNKNTGEELVITSPQWRRDWLVNATDQQDDV